MRTRDALLDENLHDLYLLHNNIRARDGKETGHGNCRQSFGTLTF